jgi:hypothetical protein
MKHELEWLREHCASGFTEAELEEVIRENWLSYCKETQRWLDEFGVPF